MQKGDFVVAGSNFGLGSSREHAPQIIKIAGVGAVIAKSFARIFYRNAINIGLLAIEADTDAIDAGDELDLDIEKGILKDLTNGAIIPIEPLPPVMIKLLEDGGLVEHIKKYGDFKLLYHTNPFLLYHNKKGDFIMQGKAFKFGDNIKFQNPNTQKKLMSLI